MIIGGKWSFFMDILKSYLVNCVERIWNSFENDL